MLNQYKLQQRPKDHSRNIFNTRSTDRHFRLKEPRENYLDFISVKRKRHANNSMAGRHCRMERKSIKSFFFFF